ncbi:MAG: glycogen synthase GlgA [Clostridia bacterium]|nr:glycogen synthase GlgA [Clostridia bacterium]
MANKKKILFVGAEAMPFAATGGLGDVMGSLPAAIAAADKSVDVRVVMPLYGQVSDAWRAQMKEEAVFTVSLSWRNQYCGVYSLVKDGVTYYFIDNEYYFKRATLYGCFDDGERYAFFCKAVMDMMPHVDFYPDVLHAHDWQSAMSVVYLGTLYRRAPGYAEMRSVFTIHNIEYQGKYDFGILDDVFGMSFEYYSLMNYGGCINLMKAAVQTADIVSTVSPRYAEEILTPEYSHGLYHCLLQNSYKLQGILNGIDYVYYNPATDPVIAQKFSVTSIKDKYANKTALQESLGLPVDENIPMMAIISRLAAHKGLDLISEMAYNLMETQDAQLVILGKGEARYESFFRELQQRFPDKVRALIEYDRDLSKRIYAACDIFLMPSKSEPCGLSQMIASRYGAIPVTRETGGLYDSIKGYWEKDKQIMGNGFTFANYSSAELLDRTEAALALYARPRKRRALIEKIMNTDFSWNGSAQKYLAMYATLD